LTSRPSSSVHTTRVQRLRVLKDLGVTQVPAVVLDLDDEQERALNVGLNKISGEWDFDKLAELVSGLDELSRLQTGFETSEIDLLINSIKADVSEPLPFSDGEGGPGEDVGTGVGSGGGGHAAGGNPTGAQPANAGAPSSADGVSYVVYVSFPSKERAEGWLADQGVTHQFREGNRTFVWRVQ
jgi:hypothetical protein